jgi:hypothetical protein
MNVVQSGPAYHCIHGLVSAKNCKASELLIDPPGGGFEHAPDSNVVAHVPDSNTDGITKSSRGVPSNTYCTVHSRAQQTSQRRVCVVCGQSRSLFFNVVPDSPYRFEPNFVVGQFMIDCQYADRSDLLRSAYAGLRRTRSERCHHNITRIQPRAKAQIAPCNTANAHHHARHDC